MTMPSIEFLLMAGRALFLVLSFVVSAVIFKNWHRAALRLNARALEHGDIMLKRIDVLEARLAAAHGAIESLAERFERSTRAAASAREPLGYPGAIRLARGGASSGELVARCGISQTEAELVRRLHGASGAPRA